MLLKVSDQKLSGYGAALLSPVLLGIIPIFAKLAFAAGVDVMTVVMVRTLIAAGILWLIAFLFAPSNVITSQPALWSSLLAGSINGIGSIFFYSSLNRIDASLGQLVNITYLVFVTMMLRLIGQKVAWLTAGRVILAVLAIYLLTQGGLGAPDWVGVSMMLVAALAYAFQLVLGQRILLDVPATTMTLYAMTGMATVVSIGWFILPHKDQPFNFAAMQPVFWMGLFTAASRLTLFLGVKHLGSLQTALIGMLEILVTLAIAAAILGERLEPIQWVGAAIILITVLLSRFERDIPKFDWWAAIYLRLSQHHSTHLR